MMLVHGPARPSAARPFGGQGSSCPPCPRCRLHIHPPGPGPSRLASPISPPDRLGAPSAGREPAAHKPVPPSLMQLPNAAWIQLLGRTN
eukprot:3179-Chlamydomonas_euryale.AAC.1